MLIFLFSSTLIPLAAHHPSAPFYDPENRVSLQGTITQFVFRNPHAFLFIDVEETSETVEWQVELGAPVSLRRIGWTPDTLEVGMTVNVTGSRSRAEGSRGLCFVRMTREDNSTVLRNGRVEEDDQNQGASD